MKPFPSTSILWAACLVLATASASADQFEPQPMTSVTNLQGSCVESSQLLMAAAEPEPPSSGEMQERAVPRMAPGRPGAAPAPKTEGVVIQGKRLQALPGYVLQQGPNNQVTARRAGGGPGGGLGATTLACGCDSQDGTCTLLVQGGIATCDNTSGATCKGTCQFTTIITGLGGKSIQ
jgi:hypothetical protein